MRGNLSGSQELEYGSGGTAYDEIAAGNIGAASNYQPRLVARVLRIGSPNLLRNFQVRTRHSVNMTANMRRNLALMGGVGAIFAAILSDKTAQIYKDCVRDVPAKTTLRSWLTPIIRAGLAAKNATIVVNSSISIANPWISGGSGTTIQVAPSVLNKFMNELTNS